MKKDYIISVIMTAYNAEKSIKRAINSVLNTPEYETIEIVIVDDCSKDSTYQLLQEMAQKYSNINIFQMNQNSGGPSAPRNLGISKARGKYITFLDDDDEMIADNLLRMVKKMESEGADFGKGYLIALNEEGEQILNRLPIRNRQKREVIRDMIIGQSMTQDYIVSRQLMIDNDLKYKTDLKIGEDTVLVTKILIAADNPIYIDDYFLLYNKKNEDINNLSSTQSWGDKEVTDQIKAWMLAEETTKEIKLSYFKLRLPAAFRNLMLSIVRYSNGLSKETYKLLSDFAIQTQHDIGKGMNLSRRYSELYKAIIGGDYMDFCNKSKRRLLIAGYDLKFILPLVKYLEKDFNVKVDEWTGHNAHNEKQSKEYLQWADIIWCEWMLGNAVYYSKLKNTNQRLIIRAHRFELYREFGFDIDWSKVDMVFTVGYYYMEQFIDRFNIPRNKMRLLSNYVEDTIYTTEKTEDHRFNIGIVGILPKRKGYLKGLKVLKELVEKDSRYKLYIMGKSFNEVSWIKNNPAERAYYEECEKYIEAHNLKDHVVYSGFIEREKLYNHLGYVLSLSDNEQPESFHLAPAEAACSGSMGLILRWAGVEYIYPESVLYDTLEDIVASIHQANTDSAYFEMKTEELRRYVLEHYSLSEFLKILNHYLVHVRIAG